MVTTYFKDIVANNIWQTAAATAFPANYWLALSSTEPQDDGTGVTEPASASNYARIQMTGMANSVNGAVKNTTLLSWPKQTVSSGAVEYWALYDDATGGNLLMGGKLDSIKHLDAGTTMSIEVNGLTLNVLGA